MSQWTNPLWSYVYQSKSCFFNSKCQSKLTFLFRVLFPNWESLFKRFAITTLRLTTKNSSLAPNSLALSFQVATFLLIPFDQKLIQWNVRWRCMKWWWFILGSCFAPLINWRRAFVYFQIRTRFASLNFPRLMAIYFQENFRESFLLNFQLKSSFLTQFLFTFKSTMDFYL